VKRIDHNRSEKLECRLEHHPEFLRRVAEARADLAAGRGIPFRAPKRRARRKKGAA
jgi:hypothetical protein